jgi:hypothetical protein
MGNSAMSPTVRHDATASIRMSQETLSLAVVTAVRRQMKLGEYLRHAVLNQLAADNSTGK